MVRGLVEQEQVGPQEQQPGEGGAHAPPAGQLAERPVDIGGGEAQPAEDDPGLRLEPVPSQRVEPMLHLAVALGEGGVGVGPRHGGGEPFELALEPPDLDEPRQGLHEHRVLGVDSHLLRQISHADAGVQVDAALVRRLHPGHDAAQGGLAGPVRADQADAHAPPHAPAAPVEDGLPAVTLGDVLQREHEPPGQPIT